MERLEMIRERMQKIGPLVLLGVITVAAVIVLVLAKLSGNDLTASGTIEAVQVEVASQVGGQVVAVLVDEGEAVAAGDTLVRLDAAELDAQVAQAQAALDAAQANYDLLVAGGTPEQRAARIAAADLELTAAQQALDTLYEHVDLARADAQLAIAQAEKAIDDADRRLANLQTSADAADIDEAQATVILARDQLDKAQDDYAPYQNKAGDNLTRAALLGKLAQAQQLYDDAVRRLNNLQGTADDYEVALAAGDLAKAQAQLTVAQDRLSEMAEGPHPDDLALAEARLANAEAQAALAKADPSPTQLAAAQAQVDAAQAALTLLQLRLEKTQISAPMDGTVLFRNIEPGELAVPGAPVISVAQLDALTLTVYLPEDRYGVVSLGDEVVVHVDSFPGVDFAAEVVRIADEAEFTPRNVQTQEGRRTTVFAIELRLIDPDGRLKPGMPADVDFGN